MPPSRPAKSPLPGRPSKSPARPARSPATKVSAATPGLPQSNVAGAVGTAGGEDGVVPTRLVRGTADADAEPGVEGEEGEEGKEGKEGEEGEDGAGEAEEGEEGEEGEEQEEGDDKPAEAEESAPSSAAAAGAAADPAGPPRQVAFNEWTRVDWCLLSLFMVLLAALTAPLLPAGAWLGSTAASAAGGSGGLPGKKPAGPAMFASPKMFDGKRLKAPEGYHGSALIGFMDPECEHCKELKPVFAEAAEQLADMKESELRFALVNCQKNRELCERFSVVGDEPSAPGVPQLLWFRDGVEQGPYEEKRTVDDLVSWARAKQKEGALVPEVKNAETAAAGAAEQG